MSEGGLPLLNGRVVLVTAGPTWAPIDAVRHISNISSGRTGTIAARALARAGARVTLLRGPATYPLTPADRRAFQVRPYCTFSELHDELKQLLCGSPFDSLVHSAAVSDYLPVHVAESKLSSSQEIMSLELRRAPKLIALTKEWRPDLLTVMFKLEVGADDTELARRAQAALVRSGADYCVANDISRRIGTVHPYLVVSEDNVLLRGRSERALAADLCRLLAGVEHGGIASADEPGTEISG